MPEFLRPLLGDASLPEIALVGLFFLLVLGFSWAPRLGEALGGLFEDADPDDTTAP